MNKIKLKFNAVLVNMIIERQTSTLIKLISGKNFNLIGCKVALPV